MKKTVIKRRKRVPAVGTTGRNSPGGPSHSEQNSPASINAPIPQTATASGAPYPTPTESEKSHPSPYGAPPSQHENRSPSIFDPVGMRRQQQQKAAVPINLGNGSSSNTERKKPWWFDDNRTSQSLERDREPKETHDREGVSRNPLFVTAVFSYPTHCHLATCTAFTADRSIPCISFQHHDTLSFQDLYVTCHLDQCRSVQHGSFLPPSHAPISLIIYANTITRSSRIS